MPVGFGGRLSLLPPVRSIPRRWRMSLPLGLGFPPSRVSLAHSSGRQSKLQSQVLNVFHQRLYRGTAIAVVPGNGCDQPDRLPVLFSLGARSHSPFQEFKSSLIFPIDTRRRAKRCSNYVLVWEGVKSAFSNAWPLITRRVLCALARTAFLVVPSIL